MTNEPKKEAAVSDYILSIWDEFWKARRECFEDISDYELAEDEADAAGLRVLAKYIPEKKEVGGSEPVVSERHRACALELFGGRNVESGERIIAKHFPVDQETEALESTVRELRDHIEQLKAINKKHGAANVQLDNKLKSLQSEAAGLREALLAYLYWRPIRPSIGGGQAAGMLSCGHVGRVGAPKCRKCTMELVKALAKPSVGGRG